KCAVTFFGVPIRISGKQTTPAERQEVAELKQALRATAIEVKPSVLQIEAMARELNAGFTPRVGEDPGDLLERANGSLLDIDRHLPPADAPQHKPLLAKLLVLMKSFGGEAEIASKLSDADLKTFLGEEGPQLARWPQRRRELEALVKEATALQQKRYDAASRKRLREVVSDGFGHFGRIGALQSQIAYLENDGTAASVDSELALLWWDYYSRSRWQPNPLHFRSQGPHPQVLMVCRLDGPQEGTAMQIVLASLKAEKDGLKGRFVIDSTGGTGPGGLPDKEGGYRQFDQKLLVLADIVRTKTTIPLTFDRSPQILPPHSVKDVALYTGWYSVRNYIPACTFNTGAVGYHVASFEMISLRTDNEKGWVAGLLNDGVVATCGAVAEPYLGAIPPPDEFFPLLLTGKLTLAECYWKTVPMTSWMMSCIGDPLYTPFRANSPLKVEDLPQPLRRALSEPSAERRGVLGATPGL
ncbi:MAG: TIGR03790 family protein, partial [Tepidisphaeraceae bacterium]